MLRMRVFRPCTRPTLACRFPVSQFPHLPSNRPRFSTTHNLYPPHGPPQYIPQQPLPQYFPQQPEQPPPSSEISKYLGTICIFLLGAFVGHHVLYEPQTGKYAFICVPLRVEQLFEDAKYRRGRAKLEQCAKDHNLGTIEGMPIMQGDEGYDPGKLPQQPIPHPGDIEAMRIEHQLNPTPELEHALAAYDMFMILSRLLQRPDLQNRTWAVAFWYATNGDYSKFNAAAPLIEIFLQGQAIIHIDALKLLGNPDYFAFAAARKIADATVFHDAERLTAVWLRYAVPALVLFAVRKQSPVRMIAKTIASGCLVSWGFFPWVCRRAERNNDEIALSMLVGAGFDPKASIGALHKIEEIQQNYASYRSIFPEHMAPLASLASRIKNLESLLPAAIEQQEELKKATEIFEKLVALQNDARNPDEPGKFSPLDEEKKNDDESKSD